MGNPACPAKEKDVKKVDIMLCTHGHVDHIGDAVEIGKKHNPRGGWRFPSSATGWARRV